MEIVYIIKIGGNVIDNESSLRSFLKDFASIGAKKILVHGGGKIATKIGEQLNIEARYVNGRRITDADTLSLVTMVYGGLINKNIVAQLQSLSCNSIGLTGADGNIILSNKRVAEEVDYGFVGDPVKDRDASTLQVIMDNGFTPVLAPLTHDGSGQLLNTNADTIASVVAVNLSRRYHVRLVYCFEKKGVLDDVNDESSVIAVITKDSYTELVAANKIHAGMLPKMQNAFNAIENGVQEIVIGHADDLLKNISAENSGTLIKA